MRNTEINRVVLEKEEDGAGFAVTVCTAQGRVLKEISRHETSADAENIARRTAVRNGLALDLSQLPPRETFASWCQNCCIKFSPVMLTGYSLKRLTCDSCGRLGDLAMIRYGPLAQ